MKRKTAEQIAREIWETRERWSTDYDDYPCDDRDATLNGVEFDEASFLREVTLILERNEKATP